MKEYQLNLSHENIPILRGYDISEKESIEYSQNYVISFEQKHIISNKLVPIAGIYCPNSCNLKCIFCSSSNIPNENFTITRKVLKRIFKEIKELGVKTIEIAALGEPTLWNDLLYIAEITHVANIKLVFFSNGLIFDDETLCKKIHKVNVATFCKILLETNTSILVKMNSTNEKIHDFLAGINKAFEKSQIGLKKLMVIGFNKTKPTKLGIACVITKHNASQIREIWKWARDNNIFPFIESLQKIGRAEENKLYSNLHLDELEIYDIYKKISIFDKKYYNIIWKPQLPYAGFPCTVFDHLIIDHLGFVRPCFKFYLKNEICGNIHKTSLRDIILESELLYSIRKAHLNNNINIICNNRIPKGFEPSQ